MKHAVVMVSALAILSGCQNVQRSMVFVTGTQVGVGVSLKPSSDAPIDLLIGYKRAEVLFDPILYDESVPGADGKPTLSQRLAIKDQPHSVIAKLLGQTSASGTTGTGQEAKAGVSVAQWFASGKAAEILAASGAAAALTDNPDVSKAVNQAVLRADLPGEFVGAVAIAAYDALCKLADGGDSKAKDLRDRMDAEAPKLLSSDVLAANRVFLLQGSTLFEQPALPPNPPMKFVTLDAHYFQLSASASALQEARKLGMPALQLDNFGNPNANPHVVAPAGDSDMGTIALLSGGYQAIATELDRRLRSSPAVLGAISYLHSVMSAAPAGK